MSNSRRNLDLCVRPTLHAYAQLVKIAKERTHNPWCVLLRKPPPRQLVVLRPPPLTLSTLGFERVRVIAEEDTMTEWVTPVFQHGRSFVKDNKDELLYLNGNVKRFPPMDLDLVNYFDLKKLFEDLGYHEFKKMCWYDPRAPSMEASLHPIYGDKKIREMCDAKREDRETNELYLFFDHPIMEDVEWSEEDEMNFGQRDDGNNNMNEEYTDDNREADVFSDDPISDGLGMCKE
ncbi:hypothetical protein Ahy_A07g033690 [Arachis hypogaea]|uniref:PB1-like domain-containing protein n=1 Tax=Arachis hypogaea TaxID=3818 RepID=A0A445CA60_ARAHY|nr:hypothetical protein Ahy_A07g033690 [Arachis hypogaea]